MHSPSNKIRSARHIKLVLQKVIDKAKKLKASITNPHNVDHDNQTETELDQSNHYSKVEDDWSEEKKAEIAHNLSGKELPEKIPDKVLEPEIDWSSPGAFTRSKSFGFRSAFQKVQRARSYEEIASLATGEVPAAIAPLPGPVQAISTDDDFGKADQSLDATTQKEKNVHFLGADTDTNSRIQKLSFGSDNTNQSVKVRDKGHDGTTHGENTGGEDDEQNGPGTKTRSASHNKSVMKKVKDKAKKLKASITNPNKHDHDNQTETEETQYDQYSKAEDNCSEEKKAESTHNLPSKDLPEQGLDQLLQQEIDWSSPGAFTRVKGFGPRSALWLEVHRVRSETATLAAGEEPAAIAPLPASVQNINTDDDFRKAKADELLGEKPYKQKNVHFLDADAK